MSSRTVARHISSIRSFHQFLIRERIVDKDPTVHLEMPQMDKKLPNVLSIEEVDALIEAPDTSKANGKRDQAMLELLYATGLRVSELVQLQLSQVSIEPGVLRIMGKGNKERLVPVGEVALDWLSAYLRHVRPSLLQNRQAVSNAVFVTRRGRAMTRQAFWYMIKRHAVQAGIDPEKLSPHTLRDYDNTFRKLEEFLGRDPPLASIKPADLSRFQAGFVAVRRSLIGPSTAQSPAGWSRRP